MEKWTELMNRYRDEMNTGKLEAAGETLRQALEEAEHASGPFKDSLLKTTRMVMNAHNTIRGGQFEDETIDNAPASDSSHPGDTGAASVALATFGTIVSSGGGDTWSSGQIVLRRLDDGFVAVHITNTLGHFVGVPKRFDARVEAEVVGAFLGRLKASVETGTPSPRTTRMAVVDVDMELEQGTWRERLEESAGTYDMDRILEAIRAFTEQVASVKDG